MAGIPGARYYAVNDRPVAVVPTADGGEGCVVFDFATGELVPDRSYFEYLIPGSGAKAAAQVLGWTRHVVRRHRDQPASVRAALAR